MAATLEQVVKQLEDSGIIPPDMLSSYTPDQDAPKDTQGFVTDLLRRGKLTDFQAEEISQGKTSSLTLGNYVILEKIGAGGMGQVFKARHRRMDRIVAVKKLPPSLTVDPAAISRFEREVHAAAKLEHPNIVTAYDADQASGIHFLVMQFVDGQDLSALVKKNGPFTIIKAVNYVLQAARGLEFAHSEGVVHRDIKPANLLLDKKGVVKILDMGLARIEQGDGPAQTELTGTGTIMGTVDYMAPEQGLSAKHADARADIYSLGCTLHYLLIGKPVYDAEAMAGKLLAHHADPIPDLRQLRDGVLEQLQAIFAKMVAKKIENRYQTMTEVVADLEKCQAGLTSAANSSTSVWIPSTTDQESEQSIAFARQPLRSIHSGDSFADEPEQKPRQPKTQPKSNRPVLVGLVATALLFGGGLAGLMFKLKTSEGTLIVEVNQPDASVEISDDQNQVEITRKSEKEPLTIAVDPGKHRLKVTKDGYEFFTQDLELKSGGKVVVKATLVPLKIAVTPVPTIPPSKVAMTGTTPAPTKPPVDRERAVAEWVLSAGGTATVRNKKGTIVTATSVSQLPSDAFTLFGISFWDKDKGRITDQDMPQMAELIGLDYFNADKQPISDAGIKYLANQKSLTALALNGTNVTGASMPLIAGFNNLTSLSLPTKNVTTEGLRHLSQLHELVLLEANSYPVRDEGLEILAVHKQMTRLELSNSGITDAAIPRLLTFADLETLWLHGNKISDIGLAHLAGLKKLKNLTVDGTQVTAAGVAALQKALPNCKIVWHDPSKAAAGQPNQPWNTPAFQAWMKTVADLPAEKQVEAVAKKLMELNPGFDGKVTELYRNGTPKIEKGVVTELRVRTDNVTDISPVRALSGLKVLLCSGSPGKGKLSDLSPLQGMKLTQIECEKTQVSDLSPLRGMPLGHLDCCHTKVSDLSPLEGMPLEYLYTSGSNAPGAMLGKFPSLLGIFVDAEQLNTLPVLNGITTIRLEDGDGKSVGALVRLALPRLNHIYLVGVNQKIATVSRESLQKAYPACEIK